MYVHMCKLIVIRTANDNNILRWCYKNVVLIPYIMLVLCLTHHDLTPCALTVSRDNIFQAVAIVCTY